MSVYGTGACGLKLRSFSWEHAYRRCHLAAGARCTVRVRLWCGFACTIGAYTPSTCIRRHAGVSLLRRSVAATASDGMLTVSSIGTGSRLCLRARLTLIRLALIRKPWSYGEGVSRPLCRYLCLHLLFRALQTASGRTFDGTRNAPLPIAAFRRSHVFGAGLDARLLSTRDRSTGELLRTL